VSGGNLVWADLLRPADYVILSLATIAYSITYFMFAMTLYATWRLYRHSVGRMEVSLLFH
jgi:hypothetical protein